MFVLNDVCFCLQDGQYIDADTQELFLTLITYNTIRTAFGYTELTFTWLPSGNIRVAARIATMPTVPYVMPRDRCAAISTSHLHHCATALGLEGVWWLKTSVWAPYFDAFCSSMTSHLLHHLHAVLRHTWTHHHRTELELHCAQCCHRRHQCYTAAAALLISCKQLRTRTCIVKCMLQAVARHIAIAACLRFVLDLSVS